MPSTLATAREILRDAGITRPGRLPIYIGGTVVSTVVGGALLNVILSMPWWLLVLLCVGIFTILWGVIVNRADARLSRSEERHAQELKEQSDQLQARQAAAIASVEAQRLADLAAAETDHKAALNDLRREVLDLRFQQAMQSRFPSLYDAISKLTQLENDLAPEDQGRDLAGVHTSAAQAVVAQRQEVSIGFEGATIAGVQLLIQGGKPDEAETIRHMLDDLPVHARQLHQRARQIEDALMHQGAGWRL